MKISLEFLDLVMDCRTCLLVNLNGGLVAIDSNDLTNEVVVSYSDLE